MHGFAMDPRTRVGYRGPYYRAKTIIGNKLQGELTSHNTIGDHQKRQIRRKRAENESYTSNNAPRYAHTATAILIR